MRSSCNRSTYYYYLLTYKVRAMLEMLRPVVLTAGPGAAGASGSGGSGDQPQASDRGVGVFDGCVAAGHSASSRRV